MTVLAVLLVAAGACGQDETGDAVASTGDRAPQQAPEDVPEDQDHPTPAPPVPQPEEGCDLPPSLSEARRAAGSAMGLIDRIAAPPLAEISAGAPTVLVGEIVGVEQGEVRPFDPDALFPDEGGPAADPQINLMANILLRVDHAAGPAAGDLSAQEVVAAPFTMLVGAPADDAYADERDTTHANLTNALRCAMPEVDAAVFVTRLVPGSAPGEPRLAELPTILGSTEPGAIVLHTDADGLVSLDASVVCDATYFGGATTLDQLADAFT